jgi:hypothetical protein
MGGHASYCIYELLQIIFPLVLKVYLYMTMMGWPLRFPNMRLDILLMAFSEYYISCYWIKEQLSLYRSKE